MLFILGKTLEHTFVNQGGSLHRAQHTLQQPQGYYTEAWMVLDSCLRDSLDCPNAQQALRYVAQP